MAARISRKELKQDEFVEAAVDFGQWLERNWPIVAKWAAGVGLVALAVSGWLVFARHNRVKAETRLAELLRTYEQVESEGFADRAKLEVLLPQFDEIVASGSAPAQVARLYRGSALYHLGRSDEAATALEQVVAGTKQASTLTATARAMLVNVYHTAGRTDDAITLLKQAVEQSDPAFPVDQALLQLGRLYKEVGRTDEARAQWQRIIDEFPGSGAANPARQELGP